MPEDWHHIGTTRTLRDGRTLGVLEVGVPDGPPVFYFPGHTQCRIEALGVKAHAERAGVRLIAIDRPGIGLSDFQPRRELLDWPDDVAQVADALGLERFPVVGFSGGGPYAAACAYALPERVTACGLLCALGPIDRFGTRGMIWTNRMQFFLARRAPWLLRAFLWMVLGRSARGPLDDEELDSLVVKFRKMTGRGVNEHHMERWKAIAASSLSAFRQGVKGPAYDARLFTRPWGFRLEDITLERVFLWNGERDNRAPASTARRMAEAIPHCRARIYPGETHEAVVMRHMSEVLETLVRRPEDPPA